MQVILADTSDAIGEWVYTGPCRTENEDALFRVTRNGYFRTRYREMSIPMALSFEVLIDNISKNP